MKIYEADEIINTLMANNLKKCGFVDGINKIDSSKEIPYYKFSLPNNIKDKNNYIVYEIVDISPSEINSTADNSIASFKVWIEIDLISSKKINDSKNKKIIEKISNIFDEDGFTIKFEREFYDNVLEQFQKPIILEYELL